MTPRYKRLVYRIMYRMRLRIEQAIKGDDWKRNMQGAE